MKIKTSNTDIKRIIMTGIGLTSLSSISWYVFGGASFTVIVPVATCIILFVIINNHRDNSKERDIIFEQIESILGLYWAVRPTELLPGTRGWAASPDFLRLVSSSIINDEPSLVLELGSGVSTVISGYAIQKVNNGSIVSLDHIEKYANKTEKHIAKHELKEKCSVVLAPMSEYDICGEKWMWYENSKIKDKKEIDMVIVDGPPSHDQSLARYPALLILREKLSGNAKILVDDADRQDTKLMVDKWKEEFSIQCEYVDTEKGAYILRFRS
jgi:predicted O-methyltransferase YrrM